jgi:hypothetical protein
MEVSGIPARLDLNAEQIVGLVRYGCQSSLQLELAIDLLSKVVKAQDPEKPLIKPEIFAMLAREFIELNQSHAGHITVSVRSQIEYLGKAAAEKPIGS